MRLFLFSCLFGTVLGTAGHAAPPDSLFVAVYTTGPAWDTGKTPTEQPFFKEHSNHLSQLRKEGTITAGARYADKGIIFFTAATLREARQRMESDVAIRHQLFNVEVQKLNVFYDGCLERPK